MQEKSGGGAYYFLLPLAFKTSQYPVLPLFACAMTAQLVASSQQLPSCPAPRPEPSGAQRSQPAPREQGKPATNSL
jgi:hypothetical protein